MPKEREPSPIVEVLSGSLQGIVSKSRDGRDFFEYRGIPYAKPPVGELRFESPQPEEKWEGVRDASSYGNMCLQADLRMGKILGSEDCLFLNVFTPKIGGGDNSLLPCLVWIHGGMWVYGSSNMYRADYFMDHDIVLVTINYRLGALGFLNTGDGVVRGNMGLKDQTLALKWIQKNIKQFGGDPQQVTIFGESAGGSAVHHHVLSPFSKGLFHRAISQSGTAVTNWATRTNPAEQAKRFAKHFVGCPVENSTAMIEYLKSVPAVKLIEASLADLKNDLRDSISVFNPSIECLVDEHAFLTEHPKEILRKGSFNKVPWVTGINEVDGLIVTASLYDNICTEIHQNYETHLPNLLWHVGELSREKLSKLFNFYIGEDGDHAVEFKNWTNMITDTGFGAPAQRSISLHSKHAQAFAYYYSFKGEFSLADLLYALRGKYPIVVEYLAYFVPRWLKKKVLGIEPVHHGACHFDECALLFPLMPLKQFIKTTDKDYQFSKDIVQTWVEFASATDLNTMQFKGVAWPESNSENDEPLKYLHIDTIPCIIDEPHPERNTFWNNELLGGLNPN